MVLESYFLRFKSCHLEKAVAVLAILFGLGLGGTPSYKGLVAFSLIQCPDVSHFWIMSAISQEQLNKKACETHHLMALFLSYLSIYSTTICD